MARALTDRQIREIGHDLLPCDHGRSLKLGEIARNNGITRQVLNKLLSGRHSLSVQMYAYMDDMRAESEDIKAKKASKTAEKAGKK